MKTGMLSRVLLAAMVFGLLGACKPEDRQEAKDTAKEAVKDLKEEAREAAGEAREAAREAVDTAGRIAESARDKASEVAESAREKAGEAAERAKEAGKAAYDKTRDAIESRTRGEEPAGTSGLPQEAPPPEPVGTTGAAIGTTGAPPS